MARPGGQEMKKHERTLRLSGDFSGMNSACPNCKGRRAVKIHQGKISKFLSAGRKYFFSPLTATFLIMNY